jgi:AcrR family transcriptional regulator
MENDTCHFSFMNEGKQSPPIAHKRVGRPRRGTEAARTDTLITVATRIFTQDGYGSASIDKVASEAGVSTRTIYDRFKNKGDLLAAVIARLVERDLATALAPEQLDHLAPREGLTAIGEAITGRVCDPDSAALFRILATEAHRFPELAARMRNTTKARIDNAVAHPDRAAVLFLQMVSAEVHEHLLFGSPEEISTFDSAAHLKQVVDIFLNGALPRDASPHDPG